MSLQIWVLSGHRKMLPLEMSFYRDTFAADNNENDDITENNEVEDINNFQVN